MKYLEYWQREVPPVADWTNLDILLLRRVNCLVSFIGEILPQLRIAGTAASDVDEENLEIAKDSDYHGIDPLIIDSACSIRTVLPKGRAPSRKSFPGKPFDHHFDLGRLPADQRNEVRCTE